MILYCKRDGKDKGMDADKQKHPVWMISHNVLDGMQMGYGVDR